MLVKRKVLKNLHKNVIYLNIHKILFIKWMSELVSSLQQRQIYNLNLESEFSSRQSMGSSITVDKHMTNIQQWLEVTSKLQNIDFDSQVTSHIGLWKIYQDIKNKNQFSIVPVQIQRQCLNKLFVKSQCYIMYGIKKSDDENPETEQQIRSSQLNLCLQNMNANIMRNCLQTPITRNVIQGHQYRVYSLFGKKSKPKARLLSASYSLKLNDVLNSYKKLSIISGGGLLINKKLQKRPTLPFEWQRQKQTQNSNVIDLNSDNSKIDILNLFMSSRSSFLKLARKSLPIFQFKSEGCLPQIRKLKIQAQASSVHFSSTSQVTQVQKNQQAKTSKKIGLQKMSLKLDFSKPLNFAPLNLFPRNQSSQGNNNDSGSIKAIQNIGLTNRSEERRGKRQKCEEQCSQIIDGLYVSGQKVAKNYDILQKHQIKYIINCAGDYCQNWFEGKGFQYLTLFLKDSQNENIECLFYRVIDFIQNSHKKKENVLIHCIQGISRSVTFIIAYIIFKYGYDYKKAESFVKQKRTIACPNNGFMVELIQFHKRLYDQYESLNKPRVFLVSSHSKQTPQILTARMLKTQLFDRQRYIGLDSRAVYVVHVPEVVYIWVGSKCDQLKLQSYWTFANQFVKKLQKYQRAPVKVKAISEGSQDKQFLAVWSLVEAPKLYQNPQYTRLFIDGQPARPGLQRQFYEQIQQEQTENKKLFIYPDYQTGLGVFSLQELIGFCILSRVSQDRNEKHLTLHIWRDQSFQPIENEGDEDFLSKVIQTNYSTFDQENIQIIQEDHQKPSQIFKECFKN